MEKPKPKPQAAAFAALRADGPGGGATRFLPLLLVLFAGSGCAALIYEIVWYQLLQLVIGSTAVSLGVLLATFMGGLCLGSLALPRIRTQTYNTAPGQTYRSVGRGTNWTPGATSPAVPASP